MIDRKKFYDQIRTTLHKGKLKQNQVDSYECLLNEWNKRGLKDLRWLAYILATVYHEVGSDMQPKKEWTRGVGKPYGKKLKFGDGPGKRVPYSTPDFIYFGRGLTQNTWYETYERLTAAAKKQGYDWDFLNDPDLLLQMKPSVWATFHGMTTGLYTGRALKHCFNEIVDDPLKARGIINGKDRMNLIATHYYKFLEALT